MKKPAADCSEVRLPHASRREFLQATSQDTRSHRPSIHI